MSADHAANGNKATAPPIPEVSYVDEAGSWVSAALSEKLFGFPLVTVGKWRRKCPYPGVRKLLGKQVELPGVAFPVWVYSLEQLRRIGRIRDGAPEENPDWLTADQATAQGISREMLWHQIPKGQKRAGRRSPRKRRGKKVAFALGRPIKTTSKLQRIGRRVLSVRLFWRADVEALSTWLSSQTLTHLDGGKLYVSPRYVEETHEIPAVTVGRWGTKGCPYLADRAKLGSKSIRLPGGDFRIRVYLWDDVKVAIDARSGKTPIDPGHFIAPAEAEEKGVSWQYLWRYRAKDHPLLGRPIDSTTVLRPRGKRMIRVRLFSQDDVNRIASALRGGAASPRLVGRPNMPPPATGNGHGIGEVAAPPAAGSGHAIAEVAAPPGAGNGQSLSEAIADAPAPPAERPEDPSRLDALFKEALGFFKVVPGPAAKPLTDVQKGYVVWKWRREGIKETTPEIRDWWSTMNPGFKEAGNAAAADYVRKGIKWAGRLLARLV